MGLFLKSEAPSISPQPSCRAQPRIMIAVRQAQRVIIPGATSGIGAALGRRYARQGATLGLIARRKPGLEQLARELPVVSEIYPLDVRDSAAVAAAGHEFVARHGAPDIVIANAGVSVGTLTDHADDTRVFEDVIDINVIGVVNTFQPFLARMREERRGGPGGLASGRGDRRRSRGAAASARHGAPAARPREPRLRPDGR